MNSILGLFIQQLDNISVVSMTIKSTTLSELLLCAWYKTKHFTCIMLFNITEQSGGRYYLYWPSTRKEGNQRNKETSPRSHIPEEWIKTLTLRPHEPPYDDVTYATSLCSPEVAGGSYIFQEFYVERHLVQMEK